MADQRRAELLLVLAPVFWGVSYYFCDICLTELAPMTLNALRFLIAFAALGIFYRKRLLVLSRETLLWGAGIGVELVLVYISATYGIQYTSLSNAGFISCLAILVTPIIELVTFHRRPEKKLVAALLFCTLGLALLTLDDGARFTSGDVLCLLCSILYAVDIVITDRAVASPAVDPVAMSVIEIGVTGAVFLALSFLFERPHLPQTPEVWGSAIFLAVFCSGVAFVIQTTQQKHTTPSRVALIFTLEPVFSAIVAYLFAGERLRPRSYLGAALMVFSLLLAQIDLKQGK